MSEVENTEQTAIYTTKNQGAAAFLIFCLGDDSLVSVTQTNGRLVFSIRDDGSAKALEDAYFSQDGALVDAKGILAVQTKLRRAIIACLNNARRQQQP